MKVATFTNDLGFIAVATKNNQYISYIGGNVGEIQI